MPAKIFQNYLISAFLDNSPMKEARYIKLSLQKFTFSLPTPLHEVPTSQKDLFFPSALLFKKLSVF
jgi:hypothetical protein